MATVIYKQDEGAFVLTIPPGVIVRYGEAKHELRATVTKPVLEEMERQNPHVTFERASVFGL